MDKRRLVNPLLNPVVLEVLFSHLDNSTLKSIRFVHTSWAKEALHQLRESSTVKLDNPEKLQMFLNSEFRNCFFGFGFHIENCDWSKYLFDYLADAKPRFLDIYFLLTLDINSHESFDKFSRLLRQYCNKIRILCLNINNCTELLSQPNPCMENTLPRVQYPKLRSLMVRNEMAVDPKSLKPILIEILKCSPKLTEIESNIQDVEFWKSIKDIVNLKNLDTLTVPKISPEIISTCVEIPNLNLKKLSIQFDPTEIAIVLSRFAASLEYLHFRTLNESALSPIDFPAMPRLNFLDGGQSQLSFPSILSEKLPVLERLSATYWDWVFTFEVLPDIHHYWQTSQPHNNVTSFDITFPERTDISGDYVAMENFVDFSNRIKIKFPNLTNIRLANVFIKEGLESCITAIADSFGPQLKELTIKTYSSISDCDSTGLFSSLSSCINLETLDLDPCCWSALWKKKAASRHANFEDLNTTIAPLTKLQILKIPYIQEFSIQNLFGNRWERFPELTMLGILGERCVDRFEKANLRRCRPDIKIIQHDCFCSEEDSWCNHDPESHLIFQQLFETQS